MSAGGQLPLMGRVCGPMRRPSATQPLWSRRSEQRRLQNRGQTPLASVSSVCDHQRGGGRGAQFSTPRRKSRLPRRMARLRSAEKTPSICGRPDCRSRRPACGAIGTAGGGTACSAFAALAAVRKLASNAVWSGQRRPSAGLRRSSAAAALIFPGDNQPHL
jgi:hypothetical protein